MGYRRDSQGVSRERDVDRAEFIKFYGEGTFKNTPRGNKNQSSVVYRMRGRMSFL